MCEVEVGYQVRNQESGHNGTFYSHSRNLLSFQVTQRKHLLEYLMHLSAPSMMGPYILSRYSLRPVIV